jgi:hypothetical protein
LKSDVGREAYELGPPSPSEYYNAFDGEYGGVMSAVMAERPKY